jgi:Protein of unknown function (DUF4446)
VAGVILPRVPDELTSTTGVVALAAGAIALLALILAVALAVRLRKLRSAQRAVLGDGGSRDLVAHAQTLDEAFAELRQFVENTAQRLDARLQSTDNRLGRTISKTAVVRYDAYNEMSGRQSSSMALLDDTGTGVVLSSILHREQARIYVKGVRDGQSEFELSPEEDEAIRTALQV